VTGGKLARALGMSQGFVTTIAVATLEDVIS
jgi:hypothetical protein